jgi:hypothetical protein
LFGDQPLAEHVGGGGAHGVQVASQFHAACLAAPPGVHLSLDHPEFAA